MRVSRSGPLFNTGFLRRMLSAAVKHSMDDIQPLVKTLICESDCTTLKSLVHGSSALSNQGDTSPPVTQGVCMTKQRVDKMFCSLSAVECGVVIKTLKSGDESGQAEQSGESEGNVLLFSVVFNVLVHRNVHKKGKKS